MVFPRDVLTIVYACHSDFSRLTRCHRLGAFEPTTSRRVMFTSGVELVRARRNPRIVLSIVYACLSDLFVYPVATG